jgi:hypothetical protein
MFLDLPGADLKGFSLGDKVTATVSGKLVEIAAEREVDYGGGDKETIPPSIGIEIIGKASLVPKKKKKSDFEKMADEDDREGD